MLIPILFFLVSGCLFEHSRDIDVSSKGLLNLSILSQVLGHLGLCVTDFDAFLVSCEVYRWLGEMLNLRFWAAKVTLGNGVTDELGQRDRRRHTKRVAQSHDLLGF